MSPRKRNRIAEQFAARVVSMLESPAYRALSLSAHRVFSRIEIEHARHGGTDNGKLPCTYGDFAEYGVDRQSIAPAIRELESLGFIKVTRGRAGNGEWRAPNLFTLTYRPVGNTPPTDEWRGVKSADDARTRARKARSEIADSPRRNQKAGRGFQPSTGVETPP